jgi:all-trans-retinol 13,14-reductase
VAKDEREFDVVVVGAGLCGLTYANTAAQRGWKVAVVEKHFKPGGYATNFIRQQDSLVFDLSQHKITGVGPTGNLRDALIRAGLWEHIQFHPYTDLTCAIIEDRRYELPVEYEAMKAKCIEYFPDDKAGLEQYFRDIETHGYQNYMFARMALGEYELDRELLAGSRALSKITAKQYFQSLFKHPHLTILWGSIATNLGCLPEEIDALYFLHFAFTFLSTGVGYVKGTAQSLSDTLSRIAEERGVEMFFAQEVEAIHVQDGRCHSVETKRTILKAPEVIATCAPHIVHKVITPGALGELFEEKLNKLKLGLSSFLIYTALDVPPAELGLTRSEYFLTSPRGVDLSDDEKQTDLRYQHWPILLTNYNKLDPSTGNTVQIAIHDHAGQWFTLDRIAYREEKDRVTQMVLDRVFQGMPQLKGHLSFVEASTPKTNYKYTRSPGGAAYGFKPTPGRNVRFLQKTNVEGLQFVGTWVNGAGYEPAICLGFTFAHLRGEKRAKESS